MRSEGLGLRPRLCPFTREHRLHVRRVQAWGQGHTCARGWRGAGGTQPLPSKGLSGRGAQQGPVQSSGDSGLFRATRSSPRVSHRKTENDTDCQTSQGNANKPKASESAPEPHQKHTTQHRRLCGSLPYRSASWDLRQRHSGLPTHLHI